MDFFFLTNYSHIFCVVWCALSSRLVCFLLCHPISFFPLCADNPHLCFHYQQHCRKQYVEYMFYILMAVAFHFRSLFLLFFVGRVSSGIAFFRVHFVSGGRKPSVWSYSYVWIRFEWVSNIQIVTYIHIKRKHFILLVAKNCKASTMTTKPNTIKLKAKKKLRRAQCETHNERRHACQSSWKHIVIHVRMSQHLHT